MAVTDEDVRQIINACAGCCCKLCSAEVHDRVVRLQAALSLPVSNTGEWQPIETAPTDGKRILMHWNGQTVLGYWLDNTHTQWPWKGWKFEGMKALNGQPTHWQPLPEAPK